MITGRKKLLKDVNNQKGMAAIITVFALIILLTLISLGFTRIMDRALRSSATDQLGTTAKYAALSAVNDGAAFIQANPTAQSNQCGKYLSTTPDDPTKVYSKLSDTTFYTCLLFDSQPFDILYRNLFPYKSQVVKLTTAQPISKLLFSWRPSDQNSNSSSLAPNPPKLLDEYAWSAKKYPPLFRLTLYPIKDQTSLDYTEQGSKTFYLLPYGDSNNSKTQVDSLPYDASSNGLQPVNCKAKDAGSDFKYSAQDYDCNVIISALDTTGANYFYARLTPFYAKTDIRAQAASTALPVAPVKFKDVQAVVDATARTGTAVKRLQAHVDIGVNNIGPSNSLPEFALHTTNTICKRLIAPSDISKAVFVEPGSNHGDACPVELNAPTPTVTLCLDNYCHGTPPGSHAKSIPRGNQVGLFWEVGGATSCTPSGGGSTSWSTKTIPPSNGTLTSDNINGNPGDQISFTLSCTNDFGISQSDKVVVTLTHKAPTVKLEANPSSGSLPLKSTLTWTVTSTSDPADSCTGRSDPHDNGWDGDKKPPNLGSQLITLEIAGTYKYYIQCRNDGGTGNEDLATVNAGSQNPEALILNVRYIPGQCKNGADCVDVTGMVNAHGTPNTHPYISIGNTCHSGGDADNPGEQHNQGISANEQPAGPFGDEGWHAEDDFTIFSFYYCEYNNEYKFQQCAWWGTDISQWQNHHVCSNIISIFDKGGGGSGQCHAGLNGGADARIANGGSVTLNWSADGPCDSFYIQCTSAESLCNGHIPGSNCFQAGTNTWECWVGQAGSQAAGPFSCGHDSCYLNKDTKLAAQIVFGAALNGSTDSTQQINVYLDK